MVLPVEFVLLTGKLGCVLIKLVATDVGFSPNSGTNADIA
jgi:hypothetical protein